MPYIGKEPARVPVTAADIPDDSITAAKILDGVITAADIGANAVNTSELVDDAVTEDKLANAINTAIAANTAKVTNATHTGDVTGATTLTIATDAVDIGMLSATGTASSTTFLRGDNTWDVPIGGVTSVNSVTGAVTATHLKTALENGIDSVHYVDGSIDAEHLASNAVTTAKINADAITGTKIADDAIGEEHLEAGAVVTAAINDDAVTAAKMADDSVLEAAIGASAVVTAAINDDAVTTAKLANSINTDIATGVTANTTANAALPKAGGTMTGTLTGTSFQATSMGVTKWYQSSNSGNPEFYIGASDTNRLGIQTVYDSSSQVLNRAHFFTQTSGGGANAGYMTFSIDDGSEKLQINDAGINVTGNIIASDKLRIVNDTASKVEFGDSGNASIGKIEYTHSGNYLYFKVNDAERMRIDSSGNVGIGTTSPAKPLNVKIAADGTLIRLGRNGVCDWDFSIGNTPVLTGVGAGALEILPQNAGMQFAIGKAGTTTANFVIASNGQIGIGGANYGTDGQVLTSTGASTAPAWEDAAAGGKILQVVSVNVSPRFTLSSGAWRDITGLTVTLTPAATSSKVLIIVNTNTGTTNSSGNLYGHGRILQGSTHFGAGDDPGMANQIRASFGMANGEHAYTKQLSVSWSYLYSPNTTSATTWKAQAFPSNTTMVINGTGENDNHNNAGRYTSTITAIEIGA